MRIAILAFVCICSPLFLSSCGSATGTITGPAYANYSEGPNLYWPTIGYYSAYPYGKRAPQPYYANQQEIDWGW